MRRPHGACTARDGDGAEPSRKKHRQRTIAEVLAATKKESGKWTFAVAALGAPGHLATIHFMRRTGVDFTITPYRGTAPALTDVLGATSRC